MRRAVFGLVVLTLASSMPARAEEGPELNPGLAIRSSAQQMMVSSVGPIAVMMPVRTLDLYRRGIRFETYEAANAQGRPIGRLTRLQLFPGRDCRLDLLVSRQASAITSLSPFRPVILAGKPFPHVPKFFELMSGRPVEQYSDGLAALFRALPAAVRAESGKPDDEPHPGAGAVLAGPPSTSPVRLSGPKEGDRAGVAPPVAVLTMTQSELTRGARLPALAGLDLDGQKVAASGFIDRPVVVCAAATLDSEVMGILRGLARLTPGLPPHSALVVLAEEAGALRERIAKVAEPLPSGPRLLPDPGKRLLAALQPPVLPYLYVFDRRHRLVFSSFWSGYAGLERDLRAHVKAE